MLIEICMSKVKHILIKKKADFVKLYLKGKGWGRKYQGAVMDIMRLISTGKL